MKEIKIDGVTYVEKNDRAMDDCGLVYGILRTYSFGVYVGYIYKRDTEEVTLKKSRMIYAWEGALSTLDLSCAKSLSSYKITAEVDSITIVDKHVFIPCTPNAKEFYTTATVWSKQ